MNKVAMLFATVAMVFASNSNAQTYSPQLQLGVAAAQENASANPSWQAVCGYKWRQYRAATGAYGRDAYYAFMRAPVEQGGCGAGENRNRTRGLAARPGDDKIKQYLEVNPAGTGSTAQQAATPAQIAEIQQQVAKMTPTELCQELVNMGGIDDARIVAFCAKKFNVAVPFKAGQ